MALLSKGSTGSPVRDLQTRLNQVLPAAPKLIVDGIFGSKTQVAVRSFQTRTPGLVPDGVVGPKTQAALAKTHPLAPPVQMLSHVVPSPLHIAQDKTMSCWFASAQMLEQWSAAGAWPGCPVRCNGRGTGSALPPGTSTATSPRQTACRRTGRTGCACASQFARRHSSSSNGIGRATR